VVEVARLHSAEEVLSFVGLIRVEEQSVEVLIHLRALILNQELYLVNQRALLIAVSTLPFPVLIELFAAVSLLALGTHGLDHLPDVEGIYPDHVEPHFKHVLSLEIFWYLIEAKEQVIQLEQL
jgi:hypothetical protein